MKRQIQFPKRRWIWAGGLLILGIGALGLSVLAVQPPMTYGSSTLVEDDPATRRPFNAPPPTNADLMMATPEFAASVPLPLTTNFDMAQVTLGRQTYTQWCATCHGDKGQGLALWRYSWDKAHQTCTKSGCHGPNHPDTGFEMLQVPPPLIGTGSLTNFQNAEQLYQFISAVMPFQAPGSLANNQYWAVTAFLADQHLADAHKQVLDHSNAPTLVLPAIPAN